MNHDIAQSLADAQQKFTAGQYDEAAALLHGILSIDPDHNETLEALSYVAAKQGFVVDRYIDEAFGVMEKDGRGKLAITRITLRPEIEFSGEKRPSGAEMAALHHEAHEECYIASSLRSEVVVEGS